MIEATSKMEIFCFCLHPFTCIYFKDGFRLCPLFAKLLIYDLKSEVFPKNRNNFKFVCFYFPNVSNAEFAMSFVDSENPRTDVIRPALFTSKINDCVK